MRNPIRGPRLRTHPIGMWSDGVANATGGV